MPRFAALAILLTGCAAGRASEVTNYAGVITKYSAYPAYTLSVEAPKPKVRHAELGEISALETLPVILDLKEAVEAGEKEVVIDIDSPGGSVAVGLNLIERMHAAQKAGVKITCRVGENAMAASMAAIIFESGCSVREMAPTAALMFHEPAISDTSGKEGDMRRMADELADVCRRTAIMVAPHLKHADGNRWSASEYTDWIKDRDRWVDAFEALEIGAVDTI